MQTCANVDLARNLELTDSQSPSWLLLLDVTTSNIIIVVYQEVRF